ncbi:MAG TPA: SIS domain-containing protein, partial [Ktedonobacteraceae bacterium]|nr:SIS domain-containing protein [Ktedonobacteraceae bacterium]
MALFSEHEPGVLESLTHEATHPDYTHAVLHALTCRRTLFNATLERFVPLQDSLSDAASRLVNVLRSGHKVLLAGNGGSAAQAQHFAAELVGRFKHERAAFAAISLATDTAILTAVANDY